MLTGLGIDVVNRATQSYPLTRMIRERAYCAYIKFPNKHCANSSVILRVSNPSFRLGLRLKGAREFINFVKKYDVHFANCVLNGFPIQANQFLVNEATVSKCAYILEIL